MGYGADRGLDRSFGEWVGRMVRGRSALLFVLLSVHSAICAVVLLTAVRFSAWPVRFGVLRFHARGTLWLLKWVCGLDVRVEGAENLSGGPFVIAANHQSAWEPLVLPALLPPFAWVLKDSLVRVPLFGWGLRRVDPIAIDRTDRRGALQRVREAGTDYLRRGVSVVVFPEGTRFPPGELGRFQSGAILLARAAGVPLVSVGHDAGRFWPAGGGCIAPGTVTVRIGAPVYDHLGESRPARELNQQLRRQIAFLASPMEFPEKAR